MNIQQTLASAAERLQGVSDSARLDAELLLCYVLGVNRTYLFTWPERELSAEEQQSLEPVLARRESGEPVAHILGWREFWSLELAVTADTLIPRPETELLVEAALERIPSDARWQIADLGTGSGAIALAIASERPSCHITAVERSPHALKVAQQNAERLAITNVTFLLGSWFEPLTGQCFQLIVSNPPYIPSADPHLSEGDVRFEPASALIAGEDGLDDIRFLVANAPQYLESSGCLLLEHGFDQGEAVVDLMNQSGYAAVEDLIDLQGHGRVTVGCQPTVEEAKPT